MFLGEVPTDQFTLVQILDSFDQWTMAIPRFLSMHQAYPMRLAGGKIGELFCGGWGRRTNQLIMVELGVKFFLLEQVMREA